MDKLIEDWINKFKEKVPKDEEKLVQAFRQYLLNNLEFAKQNPIEPIEQHEEFETLLINRISDRIMNYDIDSIKRQLLIDSNFEQLINKSGELYRIACEKLRGNNAENDINIDKEVEEIIELSKKVEPYNKNEARMLLSEAVLDAKFIKNPNNQGESLRLHRERERLNIKYEREEK